MLSLYIQQKYYTNKWCLFYIIFFFILVINQLDAQNFVLQ